MSWRAVPWPSFVTGLKRLRDSGKAYAPMMNDLLGQLEHSYEERLGFWKGGTVSVFGYGGGIIPRFSEVAENSRLPKNSIPCALCRQQACIIPLIFCAK